MNERDIFIVALQKDSPAERQAYLDEACAGMPELRRQIEELLGLHERAGRFLEQPILSPEVPLEEPHVLPEKPGSTIGSYKLLEKIGEGGFGVVYMAEQVKPVRRKVALKILKLGMDTRPVIARFEAERQALALMDHPNIARVFDGGATPSGRPYFVMELVRGVPITEFCEQNQLTPRERLELFIPVCQAVQHAHQKGIIHRDLKPLNILVSKHDTTPVVKVIDFGIAKALGQELTDKTLFTGFAQMVGTPLYMSPEQAGMSDLDIDTRSDIYSLGVLLYELLTGTTPFDKDRFKQAAFDEVRRIIREEDPPKPSTRLSESRKSNPATATQPGTEPLKLARLVRGELDWIVMKALEKARNRRYETATSFAADVQRFLNDQVIEAGPPSVWYRRRKAIRRNRRLLLAGTVLGLAAAAAVGSLGWALGDRMERRAAADRGAAIALAEAQDALIAGRRAEARTSLDRAGSYLVGAGDGELVRLAENLRRDLTLLDRLDLVRVRSFARSADNIAILDYSRTEQDYDEAFRDAQLDPNGTDPSTAADQCAGRVGLTDLASALDDWAAARRQLKNEAGAKHLLTVARRIDPDPWRNRVREAVDRGDVAALKALAGSPELANQSAGAVNCLATALVEVRAYPEAVAVLTAAQPRHPGDFWMNYTLGSALGRFRSGRDPTPYFMAAAALRPNDDTSAVQVGRYLSVQKDPVTRGWWDQIAQRNPTSASMHRLRGISLHDTGDLPGAIAAWKETLRLQPDNGDVRIKLAEALMNTGAYEEAIQTFDEHSRRLPPDATRKNSSLGIVINKLFRIAELLTRGPDARIRNPQLALRAATRLVELEPKNEQAVYLFGVALYQVGEYRAALEVFARPYVVGVRPGEQSFYVAMARAKLGEIDDARKRFTAAVRNAERAQASDETIRRLAAEAAAAVGVTLPPSLRDGPESPEPAPTPLTPGNWTLLDRAQIDPEQGIWKTTLTWEPVPNATRYHIQVRMVLFTDAEPNLANPIGPDNVQMVDNAALRVAKWDHGPRLIYRRAGVFFPLVCRWRVRALVEDAWTPWSREQTLWIMPPAIGELKR